MVLRTLRLTTELKRYLDDLYSRQKIGDFRKSVWNIDANSTNFNNTCETLVMFVVLYFAIFKRTDNVSVPYFSLYSRQMLCASWFLGAFTRSFS